MGACADRSLLPGAPLSDAARAPKGSYAIDIAASRAFNLDPQVLINVTDPDTCPAAALPFLAWAYSVDTWPAGATEAGERAIIKETVSVHLHKGTPKSIKDVLAAAGYGSATIVTGEDLFCYNGAATYDGSLNYGEEWNWALWAIIIENSDPLPGADLINLLIQSAPARCKLISVGYQKLFFRYNAAFSYDGARNYISTYTEAP